LKQLNFISFFILLAFNQSRHIV